MSINQIRALVGMRMPHKYEVNSVLIKDKYKGFPHFSIQRLRIRINVVSAIIDGMMKINDGPDRWQLSLLRAIVP